jgi:thioredoxin 1
MSTFQSVQSANFEEYILKSSAPALLEFGAEWCGPCKRLEPDLEKLASGWGERVRIGKVDVDQSPELVASLRVMSVPTLILFMDGKEVQRSTGYLPPDRLLAKFHPYLP